MNYTNTPAAAYYHRIGQWHEELSGYVYGEHRYGVDPLIKFIATTPVSIYWCPGPQYASTCTFNSYPCMSPQHRGLLVVLHKLGLRGCAQ